MTVLKFGMTICLMKTGICNLPLHYGQAPSCLFKKMVCLSYEILSVITSEFSIDEFLVRISNPYWFQAFGCVLGFDWHSSGLTTTVCRALKQALKGREKDFGLFSGSKDGIPYPVDKKNYEQSIEF